MIDTNIRLEEYAARRAAVLKAIKPGIGVVLAGDASASLHGLFKADSAFYYLTGIAAEPGAAVLFDPTHPDPQRRCVLFLKPRNPELEAWDGIRPGLTAELRRQTGFTKIMRTNYLATALTDALRRSKQACCLHKFSVYDAPPSGDLALFRKVAERIPGVSIIDRTNLIPTLRANKSRAEVAHIRKAIDITWEAHQALLRELRPGVSERRLQQALELTWSSLGATGPAYNSIVGSGINSTVLHYHANDQVAKDGDVLCVDAACSYAGYAADITRTYPVSGKFTREQRKVYDVVLQAQQAAIRAVRPGAWFHEIDAVAREIIERAGYGDYYIHGIGHPLGIDVHDAMPDGPLKPGQVLTIEPGIYIPDTGIGIRIEDDVLVTANGHRNLSADIPRDAGDIERICLRLRK